MEALEDATLDLYELYTVGKRQYRRLKPEYLTTKLQRSKPSSASGMCYHPKFQLPNHCCYALLLTFVVIDSLSRLRQRRARHL